ncbi:MAG: 4Fe-4S binding protein [Spirochaetia bacterium]|nr:4Fe-4S binding protein [Spirochaetia bacterium]
MSKIKIVNNTNQAFQKTLIQENRSASFISAVLTAIIMFISRYKGPEGILLLDRFLPGLGWLQIIIIAVYAGFITQFLLKQKNIAKIRIRIWTLFSIVFFSQFIAGILISDTFLMTGKLHIPIPAVILAGPIYRGSGFFMPILFLATILLTGPAWCSYLCYFGAIDGVAASRKKQPSFPKEGWKTLRFFTTILVIVTAIIFRIFDTSPNFAIVGALIFGALGIIATIIISRSRGIMAHCSYYCPIGLISNLLGKISPFRIKINNSCNNCMACIPACRYNALSPKNIASGSPGFSCTLCGDCIDTCSSQSINYSFFNLSSKKSRVPFTVVIAVVHSVFIGIARI